MTSYLLTRYDVISSRCSSHFSECMFFYVFQGKKIKLVDKMKQSTHLYVSLHFKHKKNSNSLHFVTWCLFWVKSRMPAGPTPIKYYIPPSCLEDQRLSTEGIKSFWNTATYQKLEGGSITAPPLPPPPTSSLVLRWGYDCVYVRGLNESES